MYEAMMNDVKKGRAADDYRDEADDKRSAAEIEPEEDDNEPETTTAYVEDDGDSEVIDLDAWSEDATFFFLKRGQRA